MEIRRFGIGHRRHDGPPGTHGVEATPLHGDARGVVTEMAFKAKAAVAPHSNPNLTYFVVIEGGGFVQVGDERARVAAGEAVVWPPNVLHAAWTEFTPMRAIVVEFADAGPDEALLLVAGPGGAVAPAATRLAQSKSESVVGDGRLVPNQPLMPEDRQSHEQEPW